MQDKLAQQTGLLTRYIISGGVAAVAHFGLLIILVELFAVNPTVASALGFIAAIFVNYSLQYHWTFAVKGSGQHKKFFARYLLVTLSTLCINTLLFWTMNEVVGIQYFYAQVVATGVVLVINFVVNQRYTFNQS